MILKIDLCIIFPIYLDYYYIISIIFDVGISYYIGREYKIFSKNYEILY